MWYIVCKKTFHPWPDKRNPFLKTFKKNILPEHLSDERKSLLNPKSEETHAGFKKNLETFLRPYAAKLGSGYYFLRKVTVINGTWNTSKSKKSQKNIILWEGKIQPTEEERELWERIDIDGIEASFKANLRIDY